MMPLWAELLVADVVSFGVIAVVRAIINGLSISRHRSHHSAPQSSASPVPPEAQIPPPPT
jgi:hypothetical protein